MIAIQQRWRELCEAHLLGEILDDDFRAEQRRILEVVKEQEHMLLDTHAAVEVAEAVDSRGDEYCYVTDDPFLSGPDREFDMINAPFYLAKYPVTVGSFLEFLDDTGRPYPEEELARMQEVSPWVDCPAVNVSWEDARAYCRWLRSVTGEYYSLPCEKEWEKASRGVDGRLYPWGHSPIRTEWAAYSLSPHSDLTETRHTTDIVWKHEMNCSPCGCIGMVGNVWEWCLDSFDDPWDSHVLRGGAWCTDAEYVNCVSCIMASPPHRRFDHAGFRLIYLPEEMHRAYYRIYSLDRHKAKAHQFSLLDRVATPEEETSHMTPLSPELVAALDRAAARVSEEQRGESEVGAVTMRDEFDSTRTIVVLTARRAGPSGRELRIIKMPD